MNKKSICLFFHVHQPTRLRQYRFFDIGQDSHYYDDFANRTSLRKVIQTCYLPANQILLNLIKANNGLFKVAFSISGSLLEMFERYAPDMIESFKELADTGCVEFVGSTYYESLASLTSQSEFKHQILKHRNKISDLFGKEPKTFCNTELVYSDSIGATVCELGYDTFLTEGAKHILGWRNSDYVYTSEAVPELKLLLRNCSLSNDIAQRFSDKSWDVWPLTAEKYCQWLENAEGDIVNLFMEYENFGCRNDVSSGILDFLAALPPMILDAGMGFVTPSEAVCEYKPVGSIQVENAVSWYGSEGDMSAWLGNELQQDAFNKLYDLSEKLALVADPVLWSDFGHLQESANFYYMNTRFFSAAENSLRDNPYSTPYEAFINFMNILSDFIIRVNNQLAEK